MSSTRYERLDECAPASAPSPINDNYITPRHGTVDRAAIRKLYCSHSLSAWNARYFEFVITLLILEHFPGSLLWTGLFGLVTTMSAIIISPLAGSLVDTQNRLTVMSLTVMLQRLAIVLACAILFFLSYLPAPWIGFSMIVVCGVVERNCSIVNTISMERDWVVVVCDGVQDVLKDVNANMRAIDLFCSLVSPILVSLLMSWNVKAMTMIMLLWNMISPMAEYILVRQVYNSTDALHVRPSAETIEPQTIVKTLRTYASASIFLPSLSLCALYLTVLSFAAPMVAYLKLQGQSDLFIAAMRSCSVVTGLLATQLAPYVSRAVGLERAGLWSLTSQALCLCPVLYAFYYDEPNYVFFTFLSLSRVGLWGYDLVVQELTQTEVREEDRGAVSGSEQALKNCFELCTWLLVVIFNRPEDFYIPATISVISVVTAASLYSMWCRQRRGHLFHLDKLPCAT